MYGRCHHDWCEAGRCSLGVSSKPGGRVGAKGTPAASHRAASWRSCWAIVVMRALPTIVGLPAQRFEERVRWAGEVLFAARTHRRARRVAHLVRAGAPVVEGFADGVVLEAKARAVGARVDVQRLGPVAARPAVGALFSQSLRCRHDRDRTLRCVELVVDLVEFELRRRRPGRVRAPRRRRRPWSS